MEKGTFIPMIQAVHDKAVEKCLKELRKYIRNAEKTYGVSPSATDIENDFIKHVLKKIKKQKHGKK